MINPRQEMWRHCTQLPVQAQVATATSAATKLVVILYREMPVRYGLLVVIMAVYLLGAWAQAQVQVPTTAPETAAAPAQEAEPVADGAAETEAEKEVASEPPIYKSRAIRDMSLVAQATPSDQVLWWPEGENQVLALFNLAISAEPVGAVLFVQDQDLHAIRPQRLQRLRLALPEFGWTTLMVTLPPPDALPVPERELPASPEPAADATASAESAATPRPETEEVFDDTSGTVASVDQLNTPEPEAPTPKAPAKPASDIVDARLAQAIRHLHDNGQFNLVLIAEGAGAVRAARLVAQMGFDGFRAVVLLDARNQLQGEAGDLVGVIAKLSVPMLDLYEDRHIADPSDVSARAVAAKRAGHEHYVSLQMPVYEPSQDRVIKRVRGFLDAHAKGVKVDNAQVIDAP
ncbi:DUF3530 family protein [Simiduia curdlanivorans]|uniref:DUF3530 family protein n=1 Tax=Simiduia curdlanivorans TaxID=1492769 RepID=A0ABV8V5C6_9GAMM|nr:DUF3530 family protein [Simiduia curdlanivorans]MDN3637251.1 DUF3530 family protein [Simiduia curdlanivorans]